MEWPECPELSPWRCLSGLAGLFHVRGAYVFLQSTYQAILCAPAFVCLGHEVPGSERNVIVSGGGLSTGQNSRK
ncbi:hypothetical protein BDW74DRAFT_148974 [Aspergillus multicolor]|uniref:uncharacterized protein n=1 Tax=Aspergillus multicolor TaxID=41759 RepID=UPI003CCD01EA